MSFYWELCAFKIFFKLGHYTTLSVGDVIFSIHTFCKLYIQYNLCGTTVCEDVAAENAKAGRTRSFIFVIYSQDFGGSSVSWCLFSKFLAWFPMSLGVEPLLGFSRKKELPVKERLKILSASRSLVQGPVYVLKKGKIKTNMGFVFSFNNFFF